MRYVFFWDIMKCLVVFMYCCFGATYRSLTSSTRVKKSKNKEGLLDPWIWDWQVVPKRRYIITTRCYVTSQKITNLMFQNAVQDVRTEDLRILECQGFTLQFFNYISHNCNYCGGGECKSPLANSPILTFGSNILWVETAVKSRILVNTWKKKQVQIH